MFSLCCQLNLNRKLNQRKQVKISYKSTLTFWTKKFRRNEASVAGALSKEKKSPKNVYRQKKIIIFLDMKKQKKALFDLKVSKQKEEIFYFPKKRPKRSKDKQIKERDF